MYVGIYWMYVQYSSYKTERSTSMEWAYPYPFRIRITKWEQPIIRQVLNLTIVKMYTYIVVMMIMSSLELKLIHIPSS